jgi:hypothetical protein
VGQVGRSWVERLDSAIGRRERPLNVHPEDILRRGLAKGGCRGLGEVVLSVLECWGKKYFPILSPGFGADGFSATVYEISSRVKIAI